MRNFTVRAESTVFFFILRSTGPRVNRERSTPQTLFFMTHNSAFSFPASVRLKGEGGPYERPSGRLQQRMWSPLFAAIHRFAGVFMSVHDVDSGRPADSGWWFFPLPDRNNQSAGR